MHSSCIHALGKQTWWGPSLYSQCSSTWLHTLLLIPLEEPIAHVIIDFSLGSTPPNYAVSSPNWLCTYLWISVYPIVLDGHRLYKKVQLPFNRPFDGYFIAVELIQSLTFIRKFKQEKHKIFIGISSVKCIYVLGIF